MLGWNGDDEDLVQGDKGTYGMGECAGLGLRRDENRGIVEEDDQILEGETTSPNDLVVESQMDFKNAEGMSEGFVIAVLH